MKNSFRLRAGPERILLSLLLLAVSTGAAAEVLVRDAWIAEAPPAAEVHAAYLVMQNTGTRAVTLSSISSPAFERVEIHRSTRAEGMARMTQHETLVLGPGETVTFRPAGYHLMLYNADRPIVAGDEVSLRFSFSDGERLEVNAGVRNRSYPYNENAHATTHDTNTPMLPGLTVSWQYLLPQHLLSALMYKLTRITWEPFKNLFIRTFIAVYGVDMSTAEKTAPGEFRNFNEFFTRALKPDARIIDNREGVVTSPVDGYVSRSGIITAGRIIQAKDMDYSVDSLLGGDPDLAERFANGHYATLYLSPRDYHRVHMPLAGELERMIYVPGRLFSVNPATTNALEGLFARNERIINVFDTNIGKMAVVMVGAIFVGSMETVWAGEVTPARERRIKVEDYAGAAVARYARGEEIGRFNMGSTVILLFEKDRIHWDESLEPDRPVRLGEKIGEVGGVRIEE